MPTDAENLRIACVSQIMTERPGINREQAVAMCISMADRAMGTREASQPEAVKRHTPK